MSLKLKIAIRMTPISIQFRHHGPQVAAGFGDRIGGRAIRSSSGMITVSPQNEQATVLSPGSGSKLIGAPHWGQLKVAAMELFPSEGLSRYQPALKINEE
jgi:hypothetical protein